MLLRAAILLGGAIALSLLAWICAPRHLEQPAPQPFPANFHARLEQGTLTMRGSLPDQSWHDRVLRQAHALYDPLKVKIVDQLSVDAQVSPAPWLDALPGMLPVLGQMNGRGSVIVDGKSVVLSGRVATEQAKAALLRIVTPMTASGLELEDHILPATGGTILHAHRGSLQNRLDSILSRARVEFESNKATLTPKGIAVLDQLVPVLQGDPQASIEIGGHTDSFGAPEYNLDLSRRRAEAVRDYLMKRGLANRFTAVGYGATKPRTKEQTQAALQRNRRIELRVTGTGDL